jgi:hypothetical protein
MTERFAGEYNGGFGFMGSRADPIECMRFNEIFEMFRVVEFAWHTGRRAGSWEQIPTTPAAFATTSHPSPATRTISILVNTPTNRYRGHDRHCSRDHQRSQHHHHHDLEQPPTTPTPTQAPLTASTR